MFCLNEANRCLGGTVASLSDSIAAAPERSEKSKRAEGAAMWTAPIAELLLLRSRRRLFGKSFIRSKVKALMECVLGSPKLWKSVVASINRTDRAVHYATRWG